MPKKKLTKKRIVRKPLKNNKQIVKNEIKPIEKIETLNNHDLKLGLEHFIYGMLFGAVLMLIIMRILQII